MASYNHENFVGVAIESVLSQSFQDWELIIVDDHSTDGSWEVISHYRDDRITAVRLDENVGGSQAYNEALSRATGPVIFTLDSDDHFHPMKLETQLQYMQSSPGIGILGTYIGTPDSPPDDISAAAVRDWFNVPVDLGNPENWIWANRLVHSSVAISREVHNRIGIARNEFHRTPDWDMWLRALTNGVGIAVVPEELTYYRVQAGSVTHADPDGTTVEYLTISGEYWHDFLRNSGRPDLVATNINQSIMRFTQASESGQDRIRAVLDPLIHREPETLDAVLSLVTDAAATLEAKNWLEDQWRRQEQRADALQVKLNRLLR